MVCANRPCRLSLCIALLCLLSVVFSQSASLAGTSLLAPRQGVLLVADTRVADPRFREAVVLLISHDLRYSAGLIINKKTDMTTEQLPLDLPGAGRRHVYYGGPVEPGRAHLLLRSEEPPEGAVPIVDNVYYLGLGQPSVQRLADEPIRLFLGYAGWASGQLAAEIRRGDWHIVPGSADAIFSEDMDSLWSRLFAAFNAVWI